MKWKDSKPRAYYAKYVREEVKNGQGWFQVYHLPGNVYAICEPQHFQEVNVYLIIGEERALLLDTGMGICEIYPLVRELYSGEIITVNSHFHFDHIGANHCFEPVHVFDDPHGTAVSQRGAMPEALGNQLDEDMFLFGYPQGFDPAAFRIEPYRTVPMADGECFDLGGRRLKVIHTPGHSDDSIMLYDETYHILFTGDTFYLGALYAHFDCDEFGRSDLHKYLASVERAAALMPEVKALYCSHNDFIAEPEKLLETAEALRKILRGGAGEAKEAGIGHTYLEGGKKLREYVFDGFSIVCNVK